MKNAYEKFKKFFPYIIVGAILSTIFGIVAFGLSYDKQTSTFVMPATCTFLFLGFLLATIGYVIFFSIKSRHLHITKIRKNTNFLKLASWLTAAILVLLFVFETAKLIAKPYLQDATDFNAWRIVRYILTLPTAAYFVIYIFPTKIKKTKINFPNWLKYTLSICTILWAIVGLLSVYFYESSTMFTNNVLRIFQIIMYLVFALFFMFEAKFEHLKPNNIGFLLSALGTFVLSMGFSLSTVISLAIGFIEPIRSFSEIELTTSFVIGLYALARVCAIPSTMKHVMDHDESGTYSSKFHKGLDDFGDEAENAENATEEATKNDEK